MGKVFTITEGLENLGALRTGGQGSVYKARRTGSYITAVKLLPTPVAAEDENDRNFRNFKNEVEKLKRVNEEPNPNVVRILSSGVTDSGSFPFIEMEYIEGPDLEELLKAPHDPLFTIKEAIKLADQLACALSHCHFAGVRHGDIKSNNVKFNIHSGNYVLLDFGLAVMSDEQRRSSMRNAGAIEFMAPEQNEGQMLFQTDIYSYGVVLFEILTGRVPFPLKDGGETARNVVRVQHMEKTVPALLQLRRENLPTDWSEERKAREMQVPDWLVTVINTCLNKKPEDRYPNGMALHEAISAQAISGGTNAELQAENTLLKQRLTDTKQEPLLVPDSVLANARYVSMREALSKRAVRVYRKWVVFLAIVLAVFAAYVAFDAFSTRNGQARIDSLRGSLTLLQAKTAQDSITIKRITRKYNASLKIQAALRKTIKQDSVAMEHPFRSLFSDSTNQTNRRKRKRFLGLF